MTEPWDFKPDDTRNADSIANFIIFFEDEVHEPFYFKSFEVGGKLKINEVTNQNQSTRNLTNTIDKCVKDGLMFFKDGKYALPENVTENIWCVYDRDLESADWEQVKQHDHIEFDTAIKMANDIGIKVAWSNDAFELWLLLHFEEVPTGEFKHRSYIYQRLTEILKSVPNKSPELESITKNILFDYKATMKSKNRFATMVMPLLYGKTAEAIGRAEKLHAYFNNDIPYHQRNPCTTVHQLVKELINAVN